MSSEPESVSRPQRLARPSLLIFDVNETLSDLAPLSQRFEDVGAPAHLRATWFAGLLRDGFALAAAGTSEPFVDLARESLRITLSEQPVTRGIEAAVEHVLDGFTHLSVHDDVPDGIVALHGQGIRLVTLSNGSAGVAEALLGGAGVREQFERLLSVEDTDRWKPAAASYAYALDECEVAAHDAMLVAVHPWDIDGAARAGLATAWLDRGGNPYPAY
ncbi:MAG: haloacid dehalogenase type II, partial [Nocardioides sp.]